MFTLLDFVSMPTAFRFDLAALCLSFVAGNEPLLASKLVTVALTKLPLEVASVQLRHGPRSVHLAQERGQLMAPGLAMDLAGGSSLFGGSEVDGVSLSPQARYKSMRGLYTAT
ncbi:TPA: hypothetical protein ACH3X1_000705 [Trebouxia sp. C0004]